MRGFFSMLFLMFFASGMAQDSIPSATTDQELQTTQVNSQTQGQAVNYALGSEEFKFIPDPLGFTIVKVEGGNELEYGHLRQTTDDGYFILTSMLDDRVSYGRFDDAGNFNAMRYDEATDQVVEENFVIAFSD